MSLHKFAEQVAANGRGEDSLLVHMTPDEVRNLQKFAQANGTTLTINPETGLPEAGLLSDLFKAVAPVALGAFLGPAGMGLSSMMAGVATGGITALATGSLSRGLMAGLGAYGGSGLGESLMNAGTGALSSAAGAGLGEEAAQQAVASKLASATPTETLSAGFNAAKASPAAMGAFAKNNMSNIGFAAAPLMAMQPTTKMPEPQDTGYIRQYDYNINPNTGRPDPTYGMRSMPLVKASEFKDKTFEGQRERFRQENPYDTGVASLRQPPTTMATGGIVALADGGVPGYSGIGGSLVGAAPPPQTIEGLYASIGRPAEKIDPEGLKYWTNQLLSSGDTTISADDLSHFRNAAQPELANRLPAIQQPMMAATNVATGTPTVGAPSPVAPSPVAPSPVAPSPVAPAPTIAQQLETRYQNNLYRAPDPGGLKYWTDIVSKDGVFSDKEKAAFDTAAKPEQMVGDIYRNILKRDPDSGGLTYWTGRINAGESPEKVYAELLAFANKNAENVAADTSYGSATKAYTGYRSTDQVNAADEWVRNTLNRDPTPEDRKQSWYKDAANALTIGSTNTAYGQFQDYAKTVAPAVIAQNIKEATAALNARGLTDEDVRAQTGKTIAELVTSGVDPAKSLAAASQLRPLGTKAGFDFSGIKKTVPKTVTETVLPTNPQTNAPPGTTNPYGNVNTPGDITRNADGSTTVTPNIPGRPFGGFSGMGELSKAYTKGGGSLGYTSPPPKTIEEFNAKYNKLTGDSQAAYDYLMGKRASPTKTTAREVATPYTETTLGVAPNIALKKMLWDPVTKTYKPNRDYTPISYTKDGTRVVGKSDNEVSAALAASEAAKTKVPAATGGLLSLANGGVLNFNQGDVVKDGTADFASWVKVNNIGMEQVARALGISVAEAEKKYGTKDKAKDEISGFKGFEGYGGSTGKDTSNEKPSDFLDAESKVPGAQAARLGVVNDFVTDFTKAVTSAVPGLSLPSFLGNFFGVPDPTAYDKTLADLNAAITGIEVSALNNVEAGRTVAAENETVAAQAAAAAAAAAGLSVADSVNSASVGYSGPSGADPASDTGRDAGNSGSAPGGGAATGGLMGLAQGGMFNLGGYSDGGRLLRGPGDGVSDSIPAMIGKKQPARLADGEFVVPARIVSELGNGSTEAGARKLYAMMERVQRARGKTTGKNKVAANSRSDKYLPA